MTAFLSHPQRNSIRLQVRQNLLLQGMSQPQWTELEPLLLVADYRKGDPLVRQGDEEMEQFFVLEGMVKRVVSNPEGREMILRFAAETEMDTSYAAWRLRTPVPYSIVAVTKVRAAELPMPVWAEFIEHYHRERNHQGLGNRLIVPLPHHTDDSRILTRERFGGLLRYYYRQAA